MENFQGNLMAIKAFDAVVGACYGAIWNFKNKLVFFIMLSLSKVLSSTVVYFSFFSIVNRKKSCNLCGLSG